MSLRVISLIAVLASLYGCDSQSYEFSLDTFPHGSKPHEANYTHILEVRTITKHQGRSCTIGPKEIRITIENSAKENLFEYNFESRVGQVDRKVNWKSVEEVTIQLTHRLCNCIESECEFQEQGGFQEIELRIDEASGKYAQFETGS